MGRIPKTQIFHGSGPNPSHWDPSIWFWPLGWSKKSEFWSSLKLPCYRAENLASKIVSLRPHFWEFRRWPDHFGNLQMRPFLCPKHNASKAMVKKLELPQVLKETLITFWLKQNTFCPFRTSKGQSLAFIWCVRINVTGTRTPPIWPKCVFFLKTTQFSRNKASNQKHTGTKVVQNNIP